MAVKMHTLGTLKAEHGGKLYTLDGDGYKLRLWLNMSGFWWHLELSYGKEWESIGTFDNQGEALASLVYKAHSLNT